MRVSCVKLFSNSSKCPMKLFPRRWRFIDPLCEQGAKLLLVLQTTQTNRPHLAILEIASNFVQHPCALFLRITRHLVPEPAKRKKHVSKNQNMSQDLLAWLLAGLLGLTCACLLAPPIASLGLGHNSLNPPAAQESQLLAASERAQQRRQASGPRSSAGNGEGHTWSPKPWQRSARQLRRLGPSTLFHRFKLPSLVSLKCATQLLLHTLLKPFLLDLVEVHQHMEQGRAGIVR